MRTLQQRCEALLHDIWFGKPEDYMAPPRSRDEIVKEIKRFALRERRSARKPQVKGNKE